jgi:TfoX/Sxy family transcriptional regulator of competence genes
VPAFEKPPAALAERFDVVAARHPEAQRRKMFGYPALFVGGNMATGLFADRWVVRMEQEDIDELLALPGAEPFAPMPGRRMSGWAVLPRDVVDKDADLDRWLARALAFAASLPPKA